VRIGALPRTLVWDREGALHAGGGRPTEIFAAFCGQLRVGWQFCAARDPEAKGIVERTTVAWIRALSRRGSSQVRATSKSSSTAGTTGAPTCASTERCALGRFA
jgi:hypothetical protein